MKQKMMKQNWLDRHGESTLAMVAFAGFLVWCMTMCGCASFEAERCEDRIVCNGQGSAKMTYANGDSWEVSTVSSSWLSEFFGWFASKAEIQIPIGGQ